MKFFVAGADDIRFYLIRRNNLNLLYTAGHHYKKGKGSFHIDKPIPHEKLFVDSGGFQFFSKLKEYPFTTTEYVDFVHKVEPDYFATLDYPCEPELLKKNKSTVKENIDKTVSKTIEIFDHEINPDIQCLPVLQGWTVEDYLYCIDEYQAHGLITDYMAIGTLCRRNQKNQIMKILATIKKSLPSFVKLHGFGVKISILKERMAYEYLHSCDSASWVSQVAHGRLCIFTGKKLLDIPYNGLPLTPHERLSICLNGYVGYVEYLIDRMERLGKHQTKLEACV